ncbi:MAG: hypothetical protein M3Q23_04225 [Actinomycetota bacterium]|nr:hypothetical protein [Actinomycetota bacterium]
MVVLLAALVWWRDSSRRAPTVAALHLSGALVYAAYDRGGANERLYVLDLATGKVSGGPLIRPVTDLVSSRAGTGWLGLIAGGYAYVLQGESPREPPVLLGVGDVLSWAPGAEALVQEVRGRSVNPECPLSTISETAVRTGGVRVLYRATECSGVLSIGADQAGAVYLTLSAPQAAAVYQLGYQRLHLLLPGYAMLSVSPVGDMIVVPEIQLLGQGPIPSSGAALFWRGKGGPLRIASGSRYLEVERVLAWSADGAFAVALGTLGGVRSVWTIRAGVGEGERVPTRIGPVLPDAPVLPGSRVGLPAASVAPDGSVYFSAQGHLYVWRHGRRTAIRLPNGMPKPAGPLAWLVSAS